MNKASKNLIYASAFMLLVVHLLYARAVWYEYVWDDLIFKQYRGFAGAVRSFTEPLYIHSGYYRPLAVLSFVISAEPSVQHGINVLLHALNTVLVLYVARTLMPQEVADSKAGLWTAGLGALLFAVHPVAVEPTVWVSGRFDTLMCSFVLGTCLAALGGEQTRRRLALVFVLFACAMGSKESAIGLPVALPFLLLLKWRLTGVDATQMKVQAASLTRLLMALALALMLYLMARWNVIHKLFASGEEIVLSGGGLLDKLNIAALTVAAFVKLIVAPMSHSAPLHPFKFESGGGVMANTLIVMVCLMVLLATVFLKKPKFNFPLALLAALAMSWPVLHIMGVPNRDNIISDRYALAPLALLLAGLAAVAASRTAVLETSKERQIALYAHLVCLLWAGMLAAYSSATIPLWRNEVTLWAFAHEQVPESRTAHGNYISTLMMQNRWKEAEEEMVTFVNMFPAAGRELGNINRLILIRARMGNLEGARDLFVRAEEAIIKMDVRSLNARDLGVFYGNMGMLEFGAGNLELAERHLEKSLRISPGGATFEALYAKVRDARAERANDTAPAGRQ